ncbi:hypothetical protein [Pyrobaculum ferrireducens]|uniref:PaREP10 n=1 Tax=Pyrobaculum ferrireducens TaxID=1104324 RepID=G7VED9_9CREN|nr:hypothetical protein [Pyrobaculum ferrireducens]AET34109.1 hypothetical protein P186_2727 [Pyrobaculum ferrireducens]
MATVKDVLGPHAYMLTRYGVAPDDDVSTAYEKLQHSAPHLANLLAEVVKF